MRVLSTKKLKENQRALLVHAGLAVVDYNAITTVPITFEMPQRVTKAIFTSQVAVYAVLGTNHHIQECYCVGSTTTALLEENGLKVAKTAQNSKELGDFIVKNHKNERFYYFCGKSRREELPTLLKEHKIEFFEVKTYETVQKPTHFIQKWDAILFFSPSGVQSYFSANEKEVKKEPFHICIGETTASEAEKFVKNIVVANATSVESVIAKTVKVLTPS